MSAWQKVKLGDLTEYRTDKVESDVLNTKNYISTDNLLVDREGIVNSVYVPESGRSSAYKNKDILISNIRPYFKKIWFANNDGGCSNDILVFPTTNENVDPKFLYYQLSKNDFFDYMMAGANGTKMPRGNKKSILHYSFNLPPLPTQKKIAKILSNYDDLIENNLKRIKLLEESARLTYEEWFLRFRIDGERLEIDSETGLPFGWERKKLKELTSYVARGISPKYVDENGVIVLNQKCIRNNFVNTDLGRLHSLDKKVSKEKKLQFGDILINSTGTGTLGRVAQIFEIKEGMTVDSHVSIVRANKMISLFTLGRTLEYLEEYITNLGKGATNQQELGRTDLESLVQVVVPTVNYQTKYEEYASPIYKVINNLHKENQLLKEARDILLPRLMTGMIDVNDMEVAV